MEINGRARRAPGVDASMLSGLLRLAYDTPGNPARKLIEELRQVSIAEVRSALWLADHLEAEREALLALGKGERKGLIDELAEAFERIYASLT